MKKRLTALFGLIIACFGCLLAFIRFPSYRGEVEPLNAEQKELAARLERHVRKLAGDIGARSVTKCPGGLERAACYIEEQLTEAGLSPERQTFAVCGYLQDGFFGATHSTESTANVIAEIPGMTKPSEIIIVGAHYDSVGDCPAANDNGSGVAALIEIGRALAKAKISRTIRLVAFTNEEPPFFRSEDMGSYRYAQSCKKRGDNVVAMLSLETIGYYSDKPNSQRFPINALSILYPNTGNFLAFIGNLESRNLLNQCAGAFHAGVKFPFEVLAAPDSIEGIDFSDHLSFWRVGYPGIMVTDTAPYRYPHYHKNDDTPEKLNYEQLARVTTGLVSVVRELGNR